MTFLVLSKWVNVVSTGSYRIPAIASEVRSWKDVTGQFSAAIAVGGMVLCQVECDAATATKIEAQGVGIVLWEKGKGDPDQATLDAVNTKLRAYGLAYTIPPGTKGDEAEVKLVTKIVTGEDTKPAETKGFFSSIFGGK